MDHEQKQIKEFMLAFNQQCPEKPCVPDLETRKLRAKLILEEALEMVEALGLAVGFDGQRDYVSVDTDSIIHLAQFGEPNLTEIADACADLNYVTKGTAIACGLDMQPIFEEVHRSNMSKLWTEKELFANLTINTWYHERVGDTDRFIVKSKDLKVIKSPSYSPANIQPIIEEQSK